ncbi:N-acetylneuraminate synthase [Desulfosporosinus metallidurans]|uniref:N-acetylneuraminate synthase n=1 Tax=Desulfosporosinus metallidurans TaxID=1888891 RepID=A0A1Q8R1Q2_9FIRM|nr:N-acetylneuraminate synthase [Desulfosporosinus metallidurans]OLN33517.1 N-acetylneuraminate synthase [Desulfosporosinus metallidurans]
MSDIFIIAEAGVNHNGDIKLAKKLIDAAKNAGVDAVKFQTFKAESLVSRVAQKADYQKQATETGESQLEMVKKLELSFCDFRELKNYCDEKEISFLSTPFDFESIDFLESLEMPIYKVPSGEITNLPYLIKIANTGKPVIMSTGMSDLDEVGLALDVLRDNGAGLITLLHCNTQYPTPFEDANIMAMLTLKERFGVAVGYSDHTLGIEAPIAAIALGASVIEKHFTLDKSLEGPDHKASLNPQELKAMVTAIRNIEIALGDGIKRPSVSEIPNKEVARKSIVAKRNIVKDEIFTEDNITVKRPGNGISPMKWFEVLGTKAERDFCEDELIEL